MDDVVYRQQAIDVLDVGKELLSCALDNMDIVGNDREKFEWGLGLIESYIDDIKDIPSAQPEPHWIPCSEVLPKYPFRVQIQLDNGWIITGYYSEEHWYTVPHCGGFLRNDEVEAWRELPKPYDGSDAK